uniref:Uncharacterized protein n=1 Tax=Myoviridae sp. ct2798 TaxID=2827285 RepID=A0A8S5R4C4_9CAUD|nr:MAG TPA: hypothetical protein [Myoviridae sp. ct2798]
MNHLADDLNIGVVFKSLTCFKSRRSLSRVFYTPATGRPHD